MLEPSHQTWTQPCTGLLPSVPIPAAQMLAKAAMEEAAAALSVRHAGPDELRRADEAAERAARDAASDGQRDAQGSPDLALRRGMATPGAGNITPDVRLWHRAVVVHQVREQVVYVCCTTLGVWLWLWRHTAIVHQGARPSCVFMFRQLMHVVICKATQVAFACTGVPRS